MATKAVAKDAVREVAHAQKLILAPWPSEQQFGRSLDQSFLEFLRIMLELPEWAAGLPIAGKVRSGHRYAKSGGPRTTAPKETQPSVGLSGVPDRHPCRNRRGTRSCGARRSPR
jgi:hypothetical protein